MLGKFFECEADKNGKYYKCIQTKKEYQDGRRFPMNEIVECDNKINLEATDINQMGGFCLSTDECIFRWLVRGDTLCEVIIPENEKIYKTASENGIYLAEKIVLKNPQKMNDDLAMKLYLNSKLPTESYFRAMTACAICGYMNTAFRVCEDKVNQENREKAILEFEGFCQRRTKEKMMEDDLAKQNVDKLYKRLKNIKNFK